LSVEQVLVELGRGQVIRGRVGSLRVARFVEGTAELPQEAGQSVVLFVHI
jgi:hypothetical protein